MKHKYRNEHCEDCDTEREFVFEQPYPGTRETPPEPGGWICQECGWTLPEDYDFDPDLGGYYDEEW